MILQVLYARYFWVDTKGLINFNPMDEYNEYEHYETPNQDWKTLRNIAFASLAVGLILAFIKDSDAIRGPSSGGNASNFILLFGASILGRAVACLIIPTIVFALVKGYSAITKKPTSIPKTLWVIWIVTVALSLLGQLKGH